jgi:raffinose/stachyose/melibiose transport system substrate-binding protein
MKKLAFIIMAGFMIFGREVYGGGRQSANTSAAKVREAELNIMMSIPQHMDRWEAYCRQFEAKILAEKNIRLRINLEMPSSDQYDSVLQTRLTGGDAPDLYAIHSNNIAVYSAAGNLMDLSSQPLAGKIYKNVIETVSINGKLMAVPIESQAWGCLYNKDIFEKCGLKPPDTLGELKRIVQALESNGYTPFLLAFQEQWVPQLMTALTLGGKISGEIPDWVKRMNKNEGSYNEVREIFEVINLVMTHGTSRAMEEGSEVGAADFANGKAAIFIQGTWASNTIMTTNPNMRLGVFPLPINDNKKCTLVNLSTSTTVGVYPGTKEPELALEFANYILDDKDSSALFQACGFNPIAVCHNYEAASWVKDASLYVAEGRAYQDLVLPSSVTNEQGKLLQELYVKSVTVDDIIQRLDKAYQDANRLSR